MAKLSAKALAKYEASRNLGEELLGAAREIKAGKAARKRAAKKAKPAGEGTQRAGKAGKRPSGVPKKAARKIIASSRTRVAGSPKKAAKKVTKRRAKA